jgi:hypothetical protein
MPASRLTVLLRPGPGAPPDAAGGVGGGAAGGDDPTGAPERRNSLKLWRSPHSKQ